MIETVMVARMNASAALVAAIGGRLHPSELPQNSPLPAITYERVSTAPGRTLDGDNGLESVRIQVDIWTDAATPSCFKQARTIAALARDAIRSGGPDIGLIGGRGLGKEPETQRYRYMQEYIGLMAEG